MEDFDMRVFHKIQAQEIVYTLMDSEIKWKCEKGHVDPYALELLIEDILNQE